MDQGQPPSSKCAQLPGGSGVLTRWWGHRPRHPVPVSPCCSPYFLVSSSQHRTRSAATVQADPQPGVELGPPACRCPSYLQVILVEPLPLTGGRRIALTSRRRQLTGCRGKPRGALKPALTVCLEQPCPSSASGAPLLAACHPPRERARGRGEAGQKRLPVCIKEAAKDSPSTWPSLLSAATWALFQSPSFPGRLGWIRNPTFTDPPPFSLSSLIIDPRSPAFIASFVHSCHRHLLSTYSELSPVLVPGNRGAGMQCTNPQV